MAERRINGLMPFPRGLACSKTQPCPGHEHCLLIQFPMMVIVMLSVPVIQCFLLYDAQNMLSCFSSFLTCKQDKLCIFFIYNLKMFQKAIKRKITFAYLKEDF